MKKNNKKIILQNSHLEIEEIFLDSILKKENKEKLSNLRLEVPVKKSSLVLFFGLSCFFILTIWINSFRLQVLSHSYYSGLCESNRFFNLKLKAERGLIFDRNGKQLVFNEIKFKPALDFSTLPSQENEREKILKQLANILGKNIQELKEFITKTQNDNHSKNFVVLPYFLSHKNLILLQTKEQELKGVKIVKVVKRKYERAGLSHILGYMGEISLKELKQHPEYSLGEWIGKEGIEKTYQKILAEKKGILKIERDVKGRIISKKIVEEPKSGQNLILTVDFSLQKVLYQSLKKIKKEVKAEGAAAVILNPKNGEILAMVSLPDFDNNIFSEGISFQQLQQLNQAEGNPQLNRVIGGVYLVGSTIKPLIGAAALEEEIITPTTKIFSPEKLCVENKFTKEKECFRDWKFHGWTDIKKAISESVNPFFYIVGGGYKRPSFADVRVPKEFKGLGVKRIKKYLQLFGWGERTGIDLPGEVKGRVPDPQWKKKYFKNPLQQKWYLGDTYNLSIGQGYILVTPLQVARAFAALVNGGKLVVPRVVKAIVNPETKQKKEIEVKIERENFISPKNLSVIKQAMRMTVSSPAGSAHLLNSLPIPSGAKTGTAQIGKTDYYNNWITVFAPYEDPEIVLTVVIEKVKGTRIAAQKVAKEVLEWYFSRSLQ